MFNVYPYLNVNDLNLDWIIAHFKEFLDAIAGLEDWRREHEAEYQQLKKLYDDILAGRFPQEMRDALYHWVVINAADIIGSAIKTVAFELTQDGYFIAYIPNSWAEIVFGTTGLDTFPAGVDYGHLTLTY